MSNRTGDSQIGVGYLGDAEFGVAHYRSLQESEFGLAENYEDPTMYHGKTPEPERIIGI